MGAHGSTPKAISGSDQALLTTHGWLAGYTFVESGGSNAATVRIYDNASAASGTLVAAANIAAGGSVDIEFARPRWFANGLYVDVGGTGTAAGSVWLA